MRKGNRRMTLQVRQKQSIRIVYAAGSMLALTAMVFVYLNFSGSKESKADVIQFKPDYTTTSDVIPTRLLLKSDGRTETELQLKAKSDTIHANRIGRSMHINDDSYIAN